IDPVIVALRGDEDVMRDFQVRHLVERSRRDIDDRGLVLAEEQRRTAILAEPAADARRGFEPAQGGTAIDLDLVLCDRGVVANARMMASAHMAMAGADAAAQFAIGRVADGAAQAAATAGHDARFGHWIPI